MDGQGAARRGLRRHDYAAARPRDDRRAGSECAREVLAGAAGDEKCDRSARTVFRARKSGELFVARTGYTGEDGFEVMLPAAQAPRTLGRSEGGGCRRSGARRARHAAARSRDESLRQGHGRDGLAARCRPRLDRRPESAARFRRPRCARAAVGKCGRAQGAGRAEAARQWRAALASEGADRRGRRRNHQRHVLADAGLLDRDGACAARGEGRRYRAGRYPRQALAGAGREDAVRAQRQGY